MPAVLGALTREPAYFAWLWRERPALALLVWEANPNVKRLLLIRHGTLIYRKFLRRIDGSAHGVHHFWARIANPMEWQP